MASSARGEAKQEGEEEGPAGAAFLYLRLDNLLVQVEEHLNPTCAGQAFVLCLPGSQHQHQHQAPLGVSTAARRAGVGPGATVAQLAQRFGTDGAVRLVPAASWAGLGPGAGEEAAVLEAYRRVAEQGPMTLIRKIVAGDGLALKEESRARGSGESRESGLGESYVVIPSAASESEKEKEREEEHDALARARDLGVFLQAEVKRLLGYELKIGVGASLDDARREARGLLVFRKRAPGGGGGGAAAGGVMPPAAAAAASTRREKGTGVDRSAVEMPPPPRPAPRAAELTLTAAAPASPAAAAGGAIDDADDNDPEPGVEVAEYCCEACGGLFFAATDLLAHTEARHQGKGSKRRRRHHGHMPAAGSATVPTSSSSSASGGLVGPGRYRFTEALGSLTEAGTIAAFLQEMGAPVVELDPSSW